MDKKYFFFLHTKFLFWGFGQIFLRQVLGLLKGSRDYPIFVNYCMFITKNSQICVQQPPFEPGKHGCYAKGCLKKDQWKVRFRLVIVASVWPLLTGGHCLEVVVRKG
jgi:hypothetical protein